MITEGVFVCIMMYDNRGCVSVATEALFVCVITDGV